MEAHRDLLYIAHGGPATSKVPRKLSHALQVSSCTWCMIELYECLKHQAVSAVGEIFGEGKSLAHGGMPAVQARQLMDLITSPVLQHVPVS